MFDQSSCMLNMKAYIVIKITKTKMNWKDGAVVK